MALTKKQRAELRFKFGANARTAAVIFLKRGGMRIMSRLHCENGSLALAARMEHAGQ